MVHESTQNARGLRPSRLWHHPTMVANLRDAPSHIREEKCLATQSGNTHTHMPEWQRMDWVGSKTTDATGTVGSKTADAIGPEIAAAMSPKRPGHTLSHVPAQA